MVCVCYQLIPSPRESQWKFDAFMIKDGRRYVAHFECLLSVSETLGLISSTIETQCGGAHLWSQHWSGGGRRIIPAT